MSASFAALDLDDTLEKALGDLGFQRPTTIQQLVITPALEGKDILACSPTGTGKTAAFMLPALQHLLDFPRRHPGPSRNLVLTPTRELALQIKEQGDLLARYTGLHLATIIGGVDYQTQEQDLQQADILIATPGRLMDYIQQGQFDGSAVDLLILDEADRMLDLGFIDAVQHIIQIIPNRKQTLLFSATLEGAGLERFAKTALTDPIRVTAEPPRSEKGKITSWIHLADDAPHKLALLMAILKQPDATKTITFVKTRERLMTLAGQLQGAGIPCAWIRGEMEQAKRTESISRFAQGEVAHLIATDVAARGIDLPNVTHVINYDLPYSADVYVHRIGRTGRAGKKGIAISLVEAHDMAVVAKIERYTEERLPRRVIDELRPQHKEARVPVKKKKAAVEAKKPKHKAKKKSKRTGKRG